MHLIQTLFLVLFSAAWASAPSSLEGRTACCWCQSRYADDSDLVKYGGAATCENLSSSLRVCRKVEVLSKTCQLVNVSRARGKLTCSPIILHYFDNGKLRTIPTPSQTLCDRRDLQSTDPRIDSESSERVRCICGRDPGGDPESCIASITQGGKLVGQETVKLENGQRGCSPDRCQQGLQGSGLARMCPTFIQGGS